MFTAFQHDPDESLLGGLDRDHLFAQPKDGVTLSQVIAQRFDYLVIHEVENAGPLVYYCHFAAEGRRHRGVFEPYHAAPYYDHLAGDLAGGGLMPDLVRV